MTQEALKDFLDEKYHFYCQRAFIDSDPIQIPHQFSQKQDIEISGFLTATIAWGKRAQIIKNASDIFKRMDNVPYDFVKNHTADDLRVFDGFVHRTFNANDLKYFVQALQHIYLHHKSLESCFTIQSGETHMFNAISRFRDVFLEIPHEKRIYKHLSNPAKNSACKRIHMFLRWMVRHDAVDFGIWKNISPALLSCPLDVHSGNIARKLNILHRKQNDKKAVLELDHVLRTMDTQDPVKYDFALFGLGVFEGF